LHATPAGEILVLRAYLAGEVATELELHADFAAHAPAWLQRQIAHHLMEEHQHAAAFAAALGDRGACAQAQPPDFITRWKIRQLRRLAQRYGARFSNATVAAVFVISLCAEQMACRVLERHCSLLGPGHPMYPLLAGVLADEQRHVRLCSQTLLRLIPPHERGLMSAMLSQARKLDRAFGITGALAMYCASRWLRLRRA
jgi:hypothetical protein